MWDTQQAHYNLAEGRLHSDCQNQPNSGCPTKTWWTVYQRKREQDNKEFLEQQSEHNIPYEMATCRDPCFPRGMGVLRRCYQEPRDDPQTKDLNTAMYLLGLAVMVNSKERPGAVINMTTEELDKAREEILPTWQGVRSESDQAQNCQ